MSKCTIKPALLCTIKKKLFNHCGSNYFNNTGCAKVTSAVVVVVAFLTICNIPLYSDCRRDVCIPPISVYAFFASAGLL